MQKKKIILLGLLILVIISILILSLSKTNKIDLMKENILAEYKYSTTIGNTEYDITNAVLEPSEIMPTISAGMIPIKYENGYWKITTANDTSWFDYKSGKPAYIMLNDGYYQSELTQEITNEQLIKNAVGNDALVVPDVSNNNPTILMWIPRFAYNNEGEILYIKQGCSIAGNYTIPEIFTYKTKTLEASLDRNLGRI